ncbi:hypothetical protein Y048_6310 [Burkholderia pseudomallei MSHR456]|nr:hypothetical protein Y048_6310 [Burkholderia pseudomallei MSHR456]
MPAGKARSAPALILTTCGLASSANSRLQPPVSKSVTATLQPSVCSLRTNASAAARRVTVVLHGISTVKRRATHGWDASQSTSEAHHTSSIALRGEIRQPRRASEVRSSRATTACTTR